VEVRRTLAPPKVVYQVVLHFLSQSIRSCLHIPDLRKRSVVVVVVFVCEVCVVSGCVVFVVEWCGVRLCGGGGWLCGGDGVCGCGSDGVCGCGCDCVWLW
jgi:hypothetical protein